METRLGKSISNPEKQGKCSHPKLATNAPNVTPLEVVSRCLFSTSRIARMRTVPSGEDLDGVNGFSQCVIPFICDGIHQFWDRMVGVKLARDSHHSVV